MLVFYLECGFSLLPNRKSFARGTPFLLRDVKKCQYFFINDLVHLNPTLTQVERVLPKVRHNGFAACYWPLTPSRVSSSSTARARLYVAFASSCGLPTTWFFTVFSTVGYNFAQNGAVLRNTLRMLNRQIPGASNAVQNSETMCNSLGVN